MGKRLWTEEEIKILEEMYSQYKPIKEISERLKKGEKAVSSKAVDLGLTKKYIKKNNTQYKAEYQNYDWCYNKFIVEGKRLNEIAKETGYTRRTLAKWICEKHRLNIRTARNYIQLSPMQKELITISTLGDGCISVDKSHSSFIVLHSEKQKDYLYWKYNILKNLCNTLPKKSVKNNSIFFGKKCNCQPVYRICTRNIEELKEIKNMSYQEKINQITPFQLCIWILDDGSYQKHSGWSLCMGLHNNEECSYFLNILNKKFQIIGKIRPQKIHDKIYNYIVFNVENSKKINDYIFKYIPNDLDIIRAKLGE